MVVISLTCLLPGVKIKCRVGKKGWNLNAEKWPLVLHVKNDHYANDLFFKKF